VMMGLAATRRRRDWTGTPATGEAGAATGSGRGERMAELWGCGMDQRVVRRKRHGAAGNRTGAGCDGDGGGVATGTGAA